MVFNYNHLYYFYVTAKQGGIVSAAKVLRIAQPSLSMQIKTLEGELNLSLFRKVGRGIALTADGERTYGYCRKMFETAEELSDYLKHSDSRKNQRCRIGVTPEIERPFIADVLSTILRNKHPQEQPLLSMISSDHSSLIEKLRSGELDAVVTNHPAYGPDIRIMADLSMPVIAVAASRLYKKLSIKKKESFSKTFKDKDVGLVLPSDNLRIRIETDSFLQKLRLPNPVVFESDILAVVVRAVVEGVGVAFLPRQYVEKELNHETLIPIGSEDFLWQHNIFIVSRNSKTPDPVVEEIKEHFISLGAKIPK